MKTRKILDIIMLLPALCAISCSHDNPPFEELSGTRWNGTNIAKGILIDVMTGVPGTRDISLTYYLDPIPYEVRGQKIDTAGNRQFIIFGEYTPVESTTDKGEHVYGYQWTFSGTEPDGTPHAGSLTYDNKRMYLLLDQSPYPMTQIL